MHIAVRLSILSLVTLFAAACDSSPPQATTDATQTADPNAPLGQLPDTIRPLRYRLDLTIRPDQPRYSGLASIYVEVKGLQRTVYLHGEELTVTSVTAEPARGPALKGTYAQVHDSGVARLTFDQELTPGRHTIKIAFNATFSPQPDALTSMPDSGDKYVWTQFEAISARRAFPSFDEPRFKTPFDIVITARNADVVVTNTPPVKEDDVGNGLKRITFQSTEPLPTYLVAVAVGPYDIKEGQAVPSSKLRVESIPLRGVTVAGKSDRTEYALRQTVPLVRYLEDYFATAFPYPKLDLIAPPNFMAGGMENAGAIKYTERGILLDENASVQQKRYFTLLHAHEVAHQWFGDLVTPKWWDDIWLNESFATWMGNKSAAQIWPEGEFTRETVRDALEVMDADALSTARSIRQPIKSNDDIANAFDGLTYNKGGGVLAMFETYLGPDAFREGVRAHMRRFPHGVADVRDFMESLAQGSGKPEIVPAFESFLNQPGVPLIRIQPACEGRDLNLAVSQSPYGSQKVDDKRLWSVPVCLRDVRGRALPCSLLSERTTTINLKNQCGAVLMPNAGGTGYYRFALPREDWQKLVAQSARLTPAEQMAMIHSLRAAFRAGDADAATYLAALQATATSGTWDTVEIARNFLSEIRGDMLAKGDVPVFEQKMRAWFAPALKRLSLDARRREAPSSSLARASLADAMVRVAREPSTLSALSAKGAAHLRAVIQSTPIASLAPELVPTALWAAVFTGGEPIARDAMAAIKASSEAEFRLAVIKALTAARDPKAIAEIEAFVVSGAITVREARTYLRELFGDDERRVGAWAWLRKDFKRISAPVPTQAHARFIDLPAKLCTEAARGEIEWFFKPMIDDLVGAPRLFANAVETVDRCVSWRKARGPELAAALRQH